ncbi:hypothetical protein OH76DRAFT_1361383, partial [Lentinus brumalis]
VCGWCTPEELLALSRVNKAMHSLLTSARSAPLWKLARSRVEGLPERPKYLTEMQYASVCFLNECLHCGCSDDSTQNPIWPFFVRYCANCAVSQCVDSSCYALRV